MEADVFLRYFVLQKSLKHIYHLMPPLAAFTMPQIVRKAKLKFLAIWQGFLWE